MTLGLLDTDLSYRSGGVYNFVSGMIESAEHEGFDLKVIGTSRDLRLGKHGQNVTFLPRVSRVNGSNLKYVRIAPFFGLYLWSTFLGNTAAVSLSYFVRRSFLSDIDWWFFPHCFLPIPMLNKAVAYCWDLQHHAYPENFASSIRWLRYRAESSLSNVNLVICASEFTRKELLIRYPNLAHKTSVVHAAPRIPRIVDRLGSRERDGGKPTAKPLFIYPAVDWPHKNHIVLLQAAQVLRERIGPAFELVVTGPRRRGSWLKHMIAKQRLTDVVVDLGMVSYTELVSLYRRAAALVFPSLYEGFGLPLVEAMVFGVPIIASNCTAIPEIAGDAAVLCEPHSAKAFSLSMERIAEDIEFYNTLADASQARSGMFSWANWWHKIVTILNCV